VTELTLQLARTWGTSTEEALVHLRRGVLLHDIGKMGIPDGILLKPGPLTDEEWVIMRQHPVYAHEMLAPIAFLRPALDIPYCHHEKWDGTGYPRGLKGEEIPLAARFFAVVDVWDALRSDRPYRAAWPAAKVCEHLRALSGAHFDPQVARLFLKIIEKAEGSWSGDGRRTHTGPSGNACAASSRSATPTSVSPPRLTCRRPMTWRWRPSFTSSTPPALSSTRTTRRVTQGERRVTSNVWRVASTPTRPRASPSSRAPASPACRPTPS
jgi:hypothetical protein